MVPLLRDRLTSVHEETNVGFAPFVSLVFDAIPYLTYQALCIILNHHFLMTTAKSKGKFTPDEIGLMRYCVYARMTDLEGRFSAFYCNSTPEVYNRISEEIKLLEPLYEKLLELSVK